MEAKKSTRTKNNKTERIEVRCTKAFKESMLEIAVHNNMSISSVIESICTDKIIERLSEDKKNFEIPSRKTKALNVTKEKKDYEKEILRLMNEGETPTKTAVWLNQNGYKPQRGDEFTINSVHSIRRRLKRQASSPIKNRN